MRKIVLDTNLLFSALRSRNTAFREKLFSDEYTFYSSKYIIVEIFKHKERIFKNGIIGFMVQMLKKPILKRIPSRSTPLRRATTIKTLLKIICTIKPIIPFKNAKIADEGEVYEYLNEILQRIHFVNEDFISLTNYTNAYKLCKDVDEFDTPFVALSLQLNAPLWSKDEKLKKGLRNKGFNDFFEG